MDRPASVVVPPAHDGTTRRPLVVLLHGYGASAGIQDTYFGLSALARERGFYLLLPDGTLDGTGSRFWNATEACCNFGGSDVDDVAYLTGLLDEVESTLPIDPDRIFFVGHSNGGFMSYRLACELSSRIAAIAVLAGSDYGSATACVPTGTPPSVLHLHGTMDGTIAYEGGTLGISAYPGAEAVVERWAGRLGCDTTMPTTGPRLDLAMGDAAGEETQTTEYTTGCMPGRGAALYTMEGLPHIPGVRRPVFGATIFDWLNEHPR